MLPDSLLPVGRESGAGKPRGRDPLPSPSHSEHVHYPLLKQGTGPDNSDPWFETPTLRYHKGVAALPFLPTSALSCSSPNLERPWAWAREMATPPSFHSYYHSLVLQPQSQGALFFTTFNTRLRQSYFHYITSVT
jgi:hypothetical protein